MKNKNIRAKLKQHNFNSNHSYSKEKDKIDNNRSSEVEISFNITPEEDELKKSINGNSRKLNTPITNPPTQTNTFSDYHNLDISELEKANIENQRQIESLLEKTKSFLEKKDITINSKSSTLNGDDNGIFVKIPSNSIKINKINNNNNIIAYSEKPSINGPICSEKHKSSKSIDDYSALDNIEESPLDNTGIKKVVMLDEKILSKDNISTVNNSLINNTSSCININSINQRILEKIKIIKSLEKELKEKNSYIQKLNNKIDKQKEEMIKLNEKLNTEKQAPFIRNENIELQKKLKAKEQELLEKNRIFEDVVGEYKCRLEKVMLTNNNSLEKIKEIENVNKTLVQNYQTLENNFKSVKSLLEKESRERKHSEDKYSNLNLNIKNLLKFIANYKNSLTSLNQNSQSVFEKINTFFIPEKNEYQTENKNYLLESNLTNSINYYQDEDYMIK